MYSVRIRRLSDRARLEGMLALRKAFDGVRRHSSAPVAEPAWWQPAATLDSDRAPEPAAVNAEAASAAPAVLGTTAALERIAESIEQLGAQLDSYHVERAQHLDAIEFLLREIVIGSMPPTATPPVVLGGVVDPLAITEGDITIIPDRGPLEAGRSVEVRSRFHDRWISGFAIAEVVEEPTRTRYRLTRRSDGIPLPILFDACDVRAATAADRPVERMVPASPSESRTRA